MVYHIRLLNSFINYFRRGISETVIVSYIFSEFKSMQLSEIIMIMKIYTNFRTQSEYQHIYQYFLDTNNNMFEIQQKSL